MDDSDNDSEANQSNRIFILFAISAPYFVMDTTKADVLLKNMKQSLFQDCSCIIRILCSSYEA